MYAFVFVYTTASVTSATPRADPHGFTGVAAHSPLVEFSVAGFCTSLCKLDMEQHCNWIVYGTDGLGGKGCKRMRPKLHLPVLGHAFRITRFMT
jgi:hypothetical protein